jgi:hypothetical protein
MQKKRRDKWEKEENMQWKEQEYKCGGTVKMERERKKIRILRRQ